MEYQYPKFTPEMKKTHTILIPNMAVTQFRLLKYALEYDGYKCEILGNCGSAVAQLGLKYVHNDTCYPALLVIGQFLDALNSGKYDLEHTALLITQTGGGCRASNYIHLLRKALVKAGYPEIPVASLNFSGLEKDSGFQMTLPLARRALACIFYGDMLCALRNQTAPYENEKGSADKLVDKWVERLGRVLLAGKGFTAKEMKHTFPLIAREFAAIPVTRVPKVKVGVVGEIYVKYSPLGNNDLQKFLESQDCEVNFPGLMGFVQYCAYNMGEDHVAVRRQTGHQSASLTSSSIIWTACEQVHAQSHGRRRFPRSRPFKELVENAQGRYLGLGCQDGRGLAADGGNARAGAGRLRQHRLCPAVRLPAQPHRAARAWSTRSATCIRRPTSRPLIMTPAPPRVNQENRIKLMLAVAKERLNNPVQEPVKPPDGGGAGRRRAPAEPRDGKRLRKREHQKSKAARRKNRAAFVVSESGDYWKYGCW